MRNEILAFMRNEICLSYVTNILEHELEKELKKGKFEENLTVDSCHTLIRALVFGRLST